MIVNGQEYELVDHTPKNKGYKRMTTILAATAMLGGLGMGDFGNSYSRSLPSHIDIIKEFELIQQKKSRLSKWEREQVVNSFNYRYKLKS